MTAAMSIPGLIDPVPVPRPEPATGDSRVELIGLTRPEIRDALIAAGLDEKQARLRARQIWHQVYHRGQRDFAAMSEIAKPQRAWLAEISKCVLKCFDNGLKYLVQFQGG
jgi:23S rRNA (adenine2503-C2)-methyltransferase